MCAPIAAVGAVLGAGLQIAGSVAGFQAQKAEYKQNAINASLAAQRGYEDTDRKFIYDTKAANIEGYKAIMDAREAKGTAIASAGSSGVDVGGSRTTDFIFSNIDNKIATINSNLAIQAEDRKMARRSNVDSLKAQAQGRINSVPKPSGAALGLNIANIAFQGLSGAYAKY